MFVCRGLLRVGIKLHDSISQELFLARANRLLAAGSGGQDQWEGQEERP
jgi:hypothetical protein